MVFKTRSADEIGISFANILTETEDLSILDYLYFYNGGGVAIGDVDNDGLPDLYFTGNQVGNKLYINKGNLQFEDVTEKAGVEGHSSWNTGVVMADVNGDGFLDIYVCAVVGINGFTGHNELFINNGDGSFYEHSKEFNLDFENFSTSASFFDYDGDGDLDMYLLNHAVHNQDSFGEASLRFKKSYQSGDKLLRNDRGKFVDVSEDAGIHSGPNGYGLGLAVSDFNCDGYPDIYVGNDFAEDDYYYINKGDGTFKEDLKVRFGHVSRFSMGSETGDVDHDGYPDLLTLDMLPPEETLLKSSQGDYNLTQMELAVNRLGHHYQFSRNMLHLNNAGKNFTEVALQSKIAATDWSWTPLFGDFNQDGELDIFVSNGIPERPNDLDYINYISDSKVSKILNKTKLGDRSAIDAMPSGLAHNFFMEGSSDLKFKDKSKTWVKDKLGVSNGAAYGDLDNDGDLDIITNNLNSPPTFYINTTDDASSFLKLKFSFKDENLFGMGTKAIIYNKGQIQMRELFTSRGFQSSSEEILHFGFTENKTIDSLQILWPDRTMQTIKSVTVNQALKIKYDSKIAVPIPETKAKTELLFKKLDDSIFDLDFVHKENHFNDFEIHRLMPYKITDRGLATTVGDIDNDGKQDMIFGGANRHQGAVFLQNNGKFIRDSLKAWANESIYEDVAVLIEDFNSDGENDVFVLTGGGLFSIHSNAMKDRLYMSKDNGLVETPLPEYYKVGTVAKAADFNNDGRLDIFIGSGAIPGEYGRPAPSYILENTSSGFELLDLAILKNMGIVTDAICTDFDEDGKTDLIVVGEWMSPKFLKNTGNDFVDVSEEILKEKLNGLWQAIVPFDIDDDGDEDYLLGNWGQNSKFRASNEFPMLMYCADFDRNGSWETVLAIAKEGIYYPFATWDDLSSQLISLTKKNYTTYEAVAGQSLFEIFNKKMLENGIVLNLNILDSGYLENDNGTYTFKPFSRELQTAPLTTFLKHDFNKDGKEEILVSGNYFGITPFQGRHDGFTGALIKNANDIQLGHTIGLDFFQKQIMGLDILNVDGTEFLLVSINNCKPQIYGLHVNEAKSLSAKN